MTAPPLAPATRSPTDQRAPAPAPVSSVVVARGAEELAPHVAAWEDLASCALEPNPFYEPWALLPALRAFGTGAEVACALIYGPDPKRPFGRPRLCGFFPLEQRRGYKGVPCRYRALWKHLYCYLCTPLLRADAAREALTAFLDWSEGTPGGALVEFGCVTGQGPFHRLLIDVLNATRRLNFPVEAYSRALYEVPADPEAYLRRAWNSKRRTELKRQSSRLAEQGKLELRTLKPGDKAASWVDAFLALEAKGWKGEEGTALGSKEPDRTFFREMAEGAHARGQLMMLGLFFNDKAIALKCTFLGGEGGVTFKIAYDETYARYSPGVQLEVANMEACGSIPGLRWLDSCAVAEHPMINRLWLERTTVQTSLISTGRAPGDLIVSVLPLLRWGRRLFRGRQSPITIPGKKG